MGDLIRKGAAGAALWLKEPSTQVVVHAHVQMELGGAPTIVMVCVDVSVARGGKNTLRGCEEKFSVEYLIPGVGNQCLSVETTSLSFQAVFKFKGSDDSERAPGQIHV